MELGGAVPRADGEQLPVDEALLASEWRLAFVRECVADLQRLAKLDDLDRDTVQRRFVEHTLQIAIQAMLDAAFAIAADLILGEPADTSRSSSVFVRPAG